MISEKALCIFTKCQHLYFLTNSKIPLEAHDITDVTEYLLPLKGSSNYLQGKRKCLSLRVETTRITTFLGAELGKKRDTNDIYIHPNEFII